jgi:multidrug efflux pump
MLINLKPLADRDVSASEVISRLQGQLQKVAGAKLYLQPVQDLTIDDKVTRTQYQYSIGAANADEVTKWTNIFIKKLNTLAPLRDVASDQQNLGLQTFIDIDRDTASRLGITAQMIDNILYDAFGQRQVSTIFTQRNQYYVVLEALPNLQKNADALNSIYLNSATGTPIPLSAFTHIRQNFSPLVINRQDQFPVATLSFNLAPNAALGDAINAINTVKNELDVPASLQTGFEGSAAVFQSSLNNEGWLVLAAILVVYIVLGVLYESYIHPMTILSTLPSACMGALLGLLMFGKALTIVALIGIILLIGIVMKNAIMMIDFALEQERQYKKPPREAIYQAALLRLRPILMTTMASLLSAVPLAFGTGMGAELRQPLGIVIIAGLMVSQLLTLYSTPVIYLTFSRLGNQLVTKHLRKRSGGEPLGELE